jgi:hypothetical protein
MAPRIGGPIAKHARHVKVQGAIITCYWDLRWQIKNMRTLNLKTNTGHGSGFFAMEKLDYSSTPN